MTNSNIYVNNILSKKILKEKPKDLKMSKIKNNLIYYNKKEHFTEYMRNCLDFELFFKIHKNKVILFDYANTKLFP